MLEDVILVKKMANYNGRNKVVHYHDVFLNINVQCNNKYVRYKGMQSINKSSPAFPHTLRHKSDQQPKLIMTLLPNASPFVLLASRILTLLTVFETQQHVMFSLRVASSICGTNKR